MALPVGNSSSGGGGDPSPDPSGGGVMEELFPAVIQCFSVTLCGYLAGRFKVISSHEGRGIELFVGKFALPTLIFLSMATLDFTVVNWNFLLAILLSKSAVFAVVLIGCLVVTRPSDYSTGALYAIFCTQSNDFALGYPIISAIYKDSHPEFVSYLYLVAPVSLCLLNPVGFVLMELWKRRHLSLALESGDGPARRRVSVCRLVLLSLKGAFTNPIVVMTGLGVVGNVVFQHVIPKVLYNILNTFSESYSATALFMLGLHMVTESKSSARSGRYVVPFILIGVKSVVMPLVTRESMSLLQGSSTANTNITIDLTNYAFLYGILPTAPSVLVYATHYETAVEVVASSLVIGTFLSAPLMFVSAWMVSLYSTVEPSQYIQYIDQYIFDISTIGLVCCVWVLGVFVLSGKFRRVPHFITTCLIVSQAVACVGAILSTQLACPTAGWQYYLHFLPLVVGVLSSRVWTALLALALLLLRTRSLCFVLRCRLPFMAIGWAFPLCLTIVLLATNEGHHMYEGDPNFQLGQFQSITAIVILSVSLTVTLSCLVLHLRYSHVYRQYTPHLIANGRGSPDMSVGGRSPEPGSRSAVTSDAESVSEGQADITTVNDIEDLVPSSNGGPLDNQTTCTRQRPCNPGQQQACRQLVRDYFDQEQSELSGAFCEAEDQLQTTKHVIMLLLLSLSMIVGLFLSVWNLVMDTMTGIYVEVDFIDGALNFGQGVFVFLLFGLDNELIVLPLVHWWRRLLYGSDTVHLPDVSDLDHETRQTCNQFINYHLMACKRELVTDKRFRLKLFRHVFTGQEMVEWLLRRGLAADRTEAVKYGRRLVDGRVVRHLRQQHHFHDRHLFYQLVNGGRPAPQSPPPTPQPPPTGCGVAGCGQVGTGVCPRAGETTPRQRQ
ncbi:integral membrane protein GPR155-like [Amphibalanus amphitrite]|uniref:integral membrane protein GPR155-like n=1 Tax=Amphibalanus amphitrite TaxID=1232801 RepID=UPI001C8FEBDE|nr:integral membrane protein GPR155-like [Amphibalanus amphitrite]XP_043209479.1 integral membrane protein GPR155-like [Amphibalanus amphitrite]